MLCKLVVVVLAVAASSADARPLTSGKDRVGVTADGSIVVLTDLCSEKPSCEPNRLQVISPDGVQVAEIYREGVPGLPLAKVTRARMHRLYDQALVALRASAREPEPARVDASGLVTFTKLGWTHAVELNGTPMAHIRIQRADGSTITEFDEPTAYMFEQLVRVGQTCVVTGYRNYAFELSGETVHVFPCS